MMDWELSFMKWAKGWWFSPVLDRIIPWVTHVGSHVAVILFILSIWGVTKEFPFFYRLFIIYGIQSGIIYGLKFTVHRKRPPFFQSAASKISKGPGEILDPSFPSAHTCFAFMMATLLSHWCPGYWAAFFVPAGFIGWTRIYLDLHYPTDVMAGGLLGYGITKVLLHLLTLSIA
jgi:undecaprenyl-diphosphatase